MLESPLPRAPRARRARLRIALSAAGLAAALVAGCGGDAGDPLEAVRRQQAAGDFAGTIEPLRELLDEQPDRPELNFLYGRALAAHGRNSLATWSFRKAMEDPEWEIPAGLALGQAALTSADFNVVVDVTSQILERDPENVAALMMRASAHAHWRHDPEQALADAARVLELSPDSVQAYEPRILALLVLEDTEAARREIVELGRRIEELESPASTHAWYCATTAIFEQESGEVEKAREIWARCLAEHPGSSEVVWHAVSFYERREESAKAIAVLRGALEAEPTMQPYRVALAERLRFAGAAAEGEALLREATKVESPEVAAGAWMDLARYLASIGERVAGTEAIERSLALTRQHGTVLPDHLFEYADALVLAGRLDRALEVAEELTVPAHRHMIRARVAQERGDAARALEEFDQGIRLWPDNPWARYYAARAAEDVGDFERALSEYRSSIRIDAAATDARLRAAEMLVAQGDLRSALQVARTIKQVPPELATQMVALRVGSRGGEIDRIEQAVQSHREGGPVRFATALAAAARGIAEGERSARDAVELLRGADGVDLRDPRQAPALRALVRYAHEAGEPVARLPELAALAARPNAGAFHEIRGLALELSGDADAAREAYARALDLDAALAGALAGLGRLSAASDPERALALFDRAAAADPADPEPKLAAARALVDAGRVDEAAERLDALLRAHPYERDAAALAARLDVDRGLASARTLERARRAVRFGGGAPALELLSRVHAARDETELAEKAAAQAKAFESPEGEEASSPTS